jgi:hypothetical protein
MFRTGVCSFVVTASVQTTPGQMVGRLRHNESERNWKKAVVIKVLSQKLPGGTEENYEKPQSGFEPSNSRITNLERYRHTKMLSFRQGD